MASQNAHRSRWWIAISVLMLVAAWLLVGQRLSRSAGSRGAPLSPAIAPAPGAPDAGTTTPEHESPTSPPPSSSRVG